MDSVVIPQSAVSQVLVPSSSSSKAVKAQEKKKTTELPKAFDPYPLADVLPFPTTFMPLRNLGMSLKESEDALYLKVNMPGVPKGGVKLWFDPKEQKLSIKGEVDTKKDPEYDYSGCEETDVSKKAGNNYMWKVNLDSAALQTDKIKAKMEDGVLKLVIPKVVNSGDDDDKEGVVRIAVN